MPKFDLREYAKEGAARRVVEITSELSDIYRAFPELRRRTDAMPRRVTATRHPMSTAQRKAVSARMKKYWAMRRAQTKKS